MIDIAAEVSTALAPVLAKLEAVDAKMDRILAALPSSWLSLKEAAHTLGCDPRTVTAMAARGECITRRAGRRVLVDAASLRPVDPATVARLSREARS